MLSQITGNPWTAERTTERVGCSALVITRSTIDPAAPTGQKVIAQGKAKRRPGIGMPETTQALKGRNRRRVNPCVMFRPFRALANWGGGAPRSPVYPGWRCALPWAISLCPVGANDPVEKTRGLSPGFFSTLFHPLVNCRYRQIGPVAFTPQGNYPSDIQGLFGISGCRTGLGKFFFMPILVGFAGPFHSPRSYTTADVSCVNDHGSGGWA